MNSMLSPSKLIEAIDGQSNRNKNDESTKYYFRLYKTLKEYHTRYFEIATEMEVELKSI